MGKQQNCALILIKDIDLKYAQVEKTNGIKYLHDAYITVDISFNHSANNEPIALKDIIYVSCAEWLIDAGYEVSGFEVSAIIDKELVRFDADMDKDNIILRKCEGFIEDLLREKWVDYSGDDLSPDYFSEEDILEYLEEMAWESRIDPIE